MFLGILCFIYVYFQVFLVFRKNIIFWFLLKIYVYLKKNIERKSFNFFAELGIRRFGPRRKKFKTLDLSRWERSKLEDT